MRADQTDVMSGYNSRRSSYYGGGGGGYDQNRYSRASHYGSHHQQAGRDSYDNGGGMGGPVGGPPRMRYNNRMQSDPGWNARSQSSNNGVYPVHNMHQSRDTVNTNGSNGSHSDGPYSNDPSDNSSFERAVPVQRPQPPPHQDMGEQYGFNGFGKGPQMDSYSQGPSNGGGYPVQAGMHNGAPPPPPKHVTQPAPIKLGGGNSSQPMETGRPKVLSKNSNDDKRKSWFKRRFSKD